MVAGRVQIAVVGASQPSERGRAHAYEVGRLLAARGAVVICGGLGGVMESACQGAHDARGLAVGIVPGERHEANRWSHAVISPGMGWGRNWVVVNSSDAVIAIEGGVGTLSELCFATQVGLPIAGLSTWNLAGIPIHACESPEEAVAWVLDAAHG